MQAIIDRCKSGEVRATPAVVISNNSRSGAMERARNEGIPAFHISGATHPDEDEAIVDVLVSHDVGLVVLAGYMKKLGPRTLARYRNAILNIHPALLPRHGGAGMYGMRVHESVIASGDTETGVTVHLADEQYDSGPVLAQVRVPVQPGDTPESLQARVLKHEHTLYAKTIQGIVDGSIVLPGS